MSLDTWMHTVSVDVPGVGKVRYAKEMYETQPRIEICPVMRGVMSAVALRRERHG